MTFTQDTLDQVKEFNDANFHATMRKVNFVGSLMHWRTPRDNSVRSRILSGYAKQQALFARFSVK